MDASAGKARDRTMKPRTDVLPVLLRPGKAAEMKFFVGEKAIVLPRPALLPKAAPVVTSPTP